MAQAKRESITRRGILSALALLPAAALPAADVAAAPSGLVSGRDPIFAAIDAFARACADLEAHIDVVAVAEQAAWHAPRGQRRAANRRLKEEYAAQGRLCDVVGTATERFVATVPATLQGAAAALAYVRERHEEGDSMCEEENFIALIGATEQAIRRFA